LFKRYIPCHTCDGWFFSDISVSNGVACNLMASAPAKRAKIAINYNTMKSIAILALFAGAEAIKLHATPFETEMSEKNHPSHVWQGMYLLNNGRRPIQLAPHGGIVPIRRSSDTYP
jgi:hypothetical protein